jgi:hypothetical protein
VESETDKDLGITSAWLENGVRMHHRFIEDKAFAGLTMRQLMVVIIGLALAYAAMGELPLPLAVRLAVGAFALLTTAAFSLWQPSGRSLEDWAFVLLRYIAVPRVVVWRVRTFHLREPEQAARFEVVLPGESNHVPRRNR